MSGTRSAAGASDTRPLQQLLADGDTKACCAALYESPAVRWLLGDELHPGGEATTRRALELIALSPGDHLLDLASGAGAPAMLAAREVGCSVTGLDYGEDAVRRAQQATAEAGLADRVRFVAGDAEQLPFDDASFDAVVCECSLCTFPDKRRAVGEIVRVLRPHGRLALADVVVESGSALAALGGPLAAAACLGEALPAAGYEELIAEAGLRVVAVESRADDAAVLAERVHDRLRGVRLLGLKGIEGVPVGVEDALELVTAAREEIAAGSLGYTIFAATR